MNNNQNNNNNNNNNYNNYDDNGISGWNRNNNIYSKQPIKVKEVSWLEKSGIRTRNSYSLTYLLTIENNLDQNKNDLEKLVSQEILPYYDISNSKKLTYLPLV